MAAPSEAKGRSRTAYGRAGLPIAARIVGAVGGGYALTAAVVPLAGRLLAVLGMARSEATVLAMMLGFVFYLLVLLWAFGVRSLLRLWTVTAGGSLAAVAALILLR